MGNRNLLAPGQGLALAPLLLWTVLALPACQQQAQDASAIPHTPIPKSAARLSVAVEEGRIRYEGVVADAATRDAIAGALESADPGATGTLAVEPLTRPAGWAKALGAAAAALRRTGGRLVFTDRSIELAGGLTQEQRATLYRRIRQLYPGYELAGAFRGADLRHALPEEGDTGALLAFLASRPIEFQPGTGMLTEPSVDALARAARGLRAAGPTARVEIRVRPEAGRDPAEQSAIAQQRADAILTQLALRGVAPGRVRAVVAPVDAGSGAVVEFVPFRADPAGMGDAPVDGSETGAAEASSGGDVAGRPVADGAPPAADATPTD